MAASVFCIILFLTLTISERQICICEPMFDRPMMERFSIKANGSKILLLFFLVTILLFLFLLIFFLRFPLSFLSTSEANVSKSTYNPAQKMKFTIQDFFSKCDQNLRKLWIWSHLLKKSLWKTSFFVECNYKFIYLGTPTK